MILVFDDIEGFHTIKSILKNYPVMKNGYNYTCFHTIKSILKSPIKFLIIASSTSGFHTIKSILKLDSLILIR